MKKTEDRERLMTLFAGFEDSVLTSYAEGRVGSGYCDDPNAPTAGAICVGDFYFVAGDPAFAGEALELVTDPAEAVFMPASEEWAAALLGLGRGLVRTTRFRTRPPKAFDMERLEKLGDISDLSGYSLEMMDEKYYEQALSERWSQAFVGNFLDYNDFARSGFGCCIAHGGKLVCAASCYSSYSRGVEVEIATHPDYRRRGLATAAGAAFIAECVRRGLTPHWDAGNTMSLKIAEKLGFSLKEGYTALGFVQEITL